MFLYFLSRKMFTHDHLEVDAPGKNLSFLIILDLRNGQALLQLTPQVYTYTSERTYPRTRDIIVNRCESKNEERRPANYAAARGGDSAVIYNLRFSR